MKMGEFGILCLCAISGMLLLLLAHVPTRPAVEPTSVQASAPTLAVVSTATPLRLYSLPAPTAVPTPTVFPLPLVAIVDVRSAVQAEIELVAIANFGNVDINLGAWQISDFDKDTFVFPEIMLRAHTGLYVHTGSGANSEIDLYWGLQRSAWEEGTVVLLDSQGMIIDQFFIQ
jgi:hypothetical protein